jgi:WD40 repeat protein
MNQEEGKVWNTQTWEKQRDFKMEFKSTFCPQSIGVSPDLQTITVAMWSMDQILTQNIVEGSLRIYTVYKEGEKIAINSKKIVDEKDYCSGENKNIKTVKLKTLEDELGDGKLGGGSRQKELLELERNHLEREWFLINIPIANVCTPISYNGKISVKLDVNSDHDSDSIIVSNLSTANFKKFSGNISERNFIATQFKPEKMTVSPDYHTIATTNNGKIGLWDVCHGKLINTIDLGLKDGFTIDLSSGSYIPAFTFIFTPDGNTLITGDLEGKIRFWQVNDSAKSSDLKPASCPIIQNVL